MKLKILTALWFFFFLGGSLALAKCPVAAFAHTNAKKESPVFAVGKSVVLDEPVPFDTQFDVYAITKTKDGFFFRVRPSKLAPRIKQIEGERFVPQTPKYDEMKDFFDFFGFKESCEPSVGCYFSQFPSATEFMARRAAWNRKAVAEGHPERAIELTYLTGGHAPYQRGMARNMVRNNGATHIGDPRDPYEQRYVPLGAGRPGKNAYKEINLDPTTGKVVVLNTLARHDLQEMIGSLFAPREVLDLYVSQADAFRKLLAILDHSSLRVTGDDMNQFKNRYVGIVDADTGALFPIDSEDGVTASRYVEILLYRAMSAQHSDFHLGNYLAHHTEGIDPKNEPDLGWGNVIQSELETHLMRTGTRRSDAKSPKEFPLAVENYNAADSKGRPLTLESMLAFNINRNNQMFIKGFDRIYAAAKALQSSSSLAGRDEGALLVGKLDSLRATHPIFKRKALTQEELKRLAETYREKMRSIEAYRHP